MPVTANPLIEQFQALDRFLVRHQALWRPRPFTERLLPWEREHPELALWLRSRTLAEAEAAHNDLVSLAAPAPFTDLATQAAALSHVSTLAAAQPIPTQARQARDVPGRKWLQVQSFCAALDFTEQPHHWLDWCAGKGHLGRQLIRDGDVLTCIEHDPALVGEGARLSQRLGVRAAHHLQDVMEAGVARFLNPAVTPVALHACGDLHVRLLRLSIERGCRQLAVAPCCYNRTQLDCYEPLSSLARRSELRLSKDDLGLPLSQTVTAGARERRQRDQSMAWRLGFDALQRQLRQQDSYLPTPSLPIAWLKKSFASYCHDLAALKGLPEPGEQPWETLERSGWQRLAEVRNLELLRALFRRPLELWLLLDRALLLAENGYSVRLGTFCATELTPRNLLLLAELPTATENSCK